jgi:DNA-binding transcriptional MerR regulator
MIPTSEMCALTGVTYRQLDFWTRSGVIRPPVDATGSGSRRRYSPDQVRYVRLAAELSLLGAETPVMAEAVACATQLPEKAWKGVVYVDREGLMTLVHPGSSCWSLHLGQLSAARELIPA